MTLTTVSKKRNREYDKQHSNPKEGEAWLVR